MKALRVLFIIGFILLIMEFFIPNVLFKNGSDEERPISKFEIMKTDFQRGKTTSYFGVILIFCLWVVIAIMAWTDPKRWVFVLGGIMGAIILIVNIVNFSDLRLDFEEVGGILSVPGVSSIVRTIASIFCVLGFIIKPEKRKAHIED